MKVAEARELANILIDAASDAEAAGKADIDLLEVFSEQASAALDELHAAISEVKATGN